VHRLTLKKDSFWPFFIFLALRHLHQQRSPPQGFHLFRSIRNAGRSLPPVQLAPARP